MRKIMTIKNLGKQRLKDISVNVITMVFLMISTIGFSQEEDKELQEEKRLSKQYLADASQKMVKEEFVAGEADYRKAIALNPKGETGKYNLGTAYYGKSKNAEAMRRFKQAASVATEKPEKHKAFHNLGNTYMNEKKYTEAVEAYKNALRNDPTDDETRYNLALAKDMLEKNPPPPENNDDKKDNKDKDKDKDKDKKDEDKDKGDNKDNKDDKDKGDQKDEEDKGKEDENKKGDQEKDNPDKPKEGGGDKPQQQQPKPGQLSPQQVQNLLEAMNNEEKKVQDKINAEKQKGAKIKTDKDW